jgi:lipopolysaccharide transport system permease protein
MKPLHCHSKPTRHIFTETLWRHRKLWWNLSLREIEGRYRGSALGWGWTLITPLLSLAVYTFVFSEVFSARWGSDPKQSGHLGFAVNLFVGLIVFGVIAEVATQSPNLLLKHKNLVTKVIFPVEVLPVVAVITALFHALTSMTVLIVFQILTTATGAHTLRASLIWLPMVWLPLAVGTLAIAWSVSALGVYLRDLDQVIGVGTNLLMFLSAVFYPLSAMPIQWQPLLELNPIALVIEQTRRIAVIGKPPSAEYLTVGILVSFAAAELAHRAFQKARNGFADVI